MNRLAFLLLTAGLLSCGFGQQPNKNQVATAGPAKRTQQAGPLEITAVDTEFQEWQCQDASITGWGVRVHIENTTDQEMSEDIGPVGLQMTNALGKRYSIRDYFLPIFTKINLGQLYYQKLQGDFLIFDTGSAVKIHDGNTDVGTFAAVIDAAKMQTNFNLQLSPKKSVTLVFVFDSPKESKPQTLFWPKAQPIDLR